MEIHALKKLKVYFRVALLGLSRYECQWLDHIHKTEGVVFTKCE